MFIVEKCVWLNVFRVTVLVLGVFRDIFIFLFNFECEYIGKFYCGWYFLYVKIGLESGFLFSVRLDVEGVCGKE